jgi:hypothetical protein
MPQVCSVCKHPQRAEIDHLLVEQHEPLRNIAKKHGTTLASLYRHKKHLPLALTKAKEAQEVADAGTLLARVGVLIARLEGLATKAEDGKQWPAAGGALREVGRCLRLLGELSRELGLVGNDDQRLASPSAQSERCAGLAPGKSSRDFAEHF